MTKLLMIRHGQSTANRDRIYIGHTDADLVDTGVRQAQMTAEYIASHYQADCVYASDLKRAYRTGEMIAAACGLPAPTPDVRLREMEAGKWENLPYPILESTYAEDFAIWRTDIGVSRCTGGESVAEMAARVKSAVEDIAKAHPGQTVVIATHATPIRAMCTLLSGKTVEQMKEVPWATNASVTEILYEDGAWTVVQNGANAHLEGLLTGVTLKKG